MPPCTQRWTSRPTPPGPASTPPVSPASTSTSAPVTSRPGKIAGCQVVVARGGPGRPPRHHRLRRPRARGARPSRHDLAHLLDDQADHRRRPPVPLRAGPGRRSKDPVERYLPEFRGVQVRQRDAEGERAPGRPGAADDRARPAHAHVGHRLRPTWRAPGPGDPGGQAAVRAPARRRHAADARRAARARAAALPPRHPLAVLVVDRRVRPALVEVVSGQRFDDYLQATIFDPLGMVDTGFAVSDADDRPLRRALPAERGQGAGPVRRPAHQCATAPSPSSCRAAAASCRRPPTTCASAGCWPAAGRSTACACWRRKTVELMRGEPPARRRRPARLRPAGRLRRGRVRRHGLRPDGGGVGRARPRRRPPARPATFLWGGLASTIFWIDPVDDLAVVFMTQLIPSGTFDFRGQLKSLVYGALVD